jgi:hypothetical protein
MPKAIEGLLIGKAFVILNEYNYVIMGDLQ